MQRTILWSIPCGALLASASAAQSFNYVDFTNTTGLVLNGNATQTGVALHITSPLTTQKGSFWYSTPVNVAAGFDTTFAFRIAVPAGNLGADGMAFVIQNDPRGTAALADSGSDLGCYAEPTSPVGTAIANGLAIEIDTYQIVAGWNDPDANHISIHTNGTGDILGSETYSLGLYSPAVNMSDGALHTMRVHYQPGTLDVYLDNTTTTPSLSVPYSFATGGTWTAGGTVGGLNLIGGTNAYVGFTAATGGSWESHNALSWSFGPLVSNPTSYCTAGTSANGCVASISANANPSVTFAHPCMITVSSVEGAKSGIIFYGLGQTATPWATGSSSYLCVKAPTQRTGTQNSGGTVTLCDGNLFLDWNAYQAANPSALGNPWLTGVSAYCQGWYRDPPAPKTTSLSNAVKLTYLP
jgi:hypothetical protein